MTNTDRSRALELMEKMAAKLGLKVSVGETEALEQLLDAADKQTATKTKAKPKKAKPVANAAGQSRHGTTYGKSPVISNGIGGQIDNVATHKARLQALEACLPGLIAYVGPAGIHSSGVDSRWAKGSNASKHTSEFRFMLPSGCFTWVLLHGGKNCNFGKFSSRDVFEGLKSCGYAYSAKNKRWATDNKGNHITRRGFGGCQGVGLDTAE